MLDVLERLEGELPELLNDKGGWSTLGIYYHPPFVDRVFRNWGEYRVYLHRLHPCDSKDALFHPHPWASAMHVLSGVYEMAVGYAAGNIQPPIAARFIASGDLKYEMNDPDSWHYVRPIGGYAMSLMVTGKRWNRWSPGGEQSLGELEPEVRDEIFAFFGNRFPNG